MSPKSGRPFSSVPLTSTGVKKPPFGVTEKVILPPAEPVLGTQAAVIPALAPFTALMMSVGVEFAPIETVRETPLGNAKDNLPATFAKLVEDAEMKLALCNIPAESLVRLSVVTKGLAMPILKSLVVPVSLLVNKIL